MSRKNINILDRTCASSNVRQQFLERAELLAALRELPLQTLVGADVLAALTGLQLSTIQHARCKNPRLIPPPLKNTARLRWRLGDIYRWLSEQPTTDVTTKR